MRHGAPYRTAGTLAALVLAVSAYAAPPAPVLAEDNVRVLTARARAHREQAMQADWRGQSYHALLQTFGPPGFIMSHPARRDPGGHIVVYGVRDPMSNCIDAFTLIVPLPGHELMVADYFCR